MDLLLFTGNDKNKFGRNCDTLYDPCDYSFTFNVGTASNHSKYFKFQTRGFNRYAPLNFCEGELLSDNSSTQTVRIPFSIPFYDTWTVSYCTLHNSYIQNYYYDVKKSSAIG